MSRLPPVLQPLWPLVKRAHRLGARLGCVVLRPASAVWGERRLPRAAYPSSAAAAGAEPAAVRLFGFSPGEQLHRSPPEGPAAQRWVFDAAASAGLPDRYTLAIDDGLVVGDYGAVITATGLLDQQTSEYFGIRGWREHPIFLRGRLPPVEKVDGSLLVLATRGGSVNYYHFLLDVLPRIGVLDSTAPDVVPEHVYLPCATGYQRELIGLLGLDPESVVATGKHRAVRADTLLVPSLPNSDELAAPWLVDWVRERLPPKDTSLKPRRIFVTRGGGRHTRRLETESALWPELARRGFVRIDPGTMSVRDQIDHFAAAEVILGVHGAALTNLVFASPGVRVLELFAPTYVKHCFWSILQSIPGASYAYLVGEGSQLPPDAWMRGVQDDIDIDPATVLAAIDRMLA